MKKFSKILGTMASVTLLAGCVTYYGDDNDGGSYYSGERYSSDADNDASCDYYMPPWGYPPDYCQYETWSEPVYFEGRWYSGPIYHRSYSGTDWFWLNGDWRHDEWRGARPRIDWNRGGNVLWRGEVHRGRSDFAGRRDVGGRDFDNDRRGAEERGRNLDNNRRGADERGYDNGGRNNAVMPNGGAGGRFGGRGPDNAERGNNAASDTGRGGRNDNAGNNPAPGNAGNGGRFGGRGPDNAERGNNAVPSGGRGASTNNAGNNPAPTNPGNGGRPDGRGPDKADRGNKAAAADANRGAGTNDAANNPAPNGAKAAAPEVRRGFGARLGPRPPANAEAGNNAANPTAPDEDAKAQRVSGRGLQQ